jgi:hypothetical protein
MELKVVSFKALNKMAQEFDEMTEEGDGQYKSAYDFYRYVVDNHEAVEKEVSKNT